MKSFVRGLYIAAMIAATAASVVAQQSAPPEPRKVGTAVKIHLEPVSYSDVYCSGFLSHHVSGKVYVAGGVGTPNQTRFVTNDFVYLDGSNLQAGGDYSIVRQVRDPNMFELYPGQQRAVGHQGHIFMDVGRVRVIRKDRKVWVAQVVFACDSVLAGDAVVPFNEREQVQYHKTMLFDPFKPAPARGRKARIILSKDFDYLVARGQKVYLNVGSKQGVKVGDYFRAYRSYAWGEQDVTDQFSYYETVADDVQVNQPTFETGTFGHHIGRGKSIHIHDLPRRGIGELVILSVNQNSSVAMLTYSLEDVHVGDMIAPDDLPEDESAAVVEDIRPASANPLHEEAPEPMPPTISCSASPETAHPGDHVIISCEASSPDDRPVTVEFSAERGKLNPQGKKAELDTQDVATGPLKVNAMASDDRGLNTSTAAIVNVEAAPAEPTASKTAEVQFRPSGARVDNKAKAILDDVTLRFEKDSQMRLVVVGFGKLNTPAGKMIAQRRADNIKTYLTKEKGIDPKRVDVRTAEGPDRADIWLLPPGTDLPADAAPQPAPQSTPQQTQGSDQPPADASQPASQDATAKPASSDKPADQSGAKPADQPAAAPAPADQPNAAPADKPNPGPTGDFGNSQPPSQQNSQPAQPSAQPSSQPANPPSSAAPQSNAVQPSTGH